MIFVPLSFCASLLLAVLFIRLLIAWREERAPGAGLFLALVGLYVVQTVLVGLRWGYGLTAVLPLLSMLASAIPPFSYLAFRALTREDAGLGRDGWTDVWHVLPTLLVGALLLSRRDLIDLVIILDFLGYGLALLWLSRHGPDDLVATRLDGVLRSWRSMRLAALVLVGSALTDVAVSLDMALFGGRHAGEVVSLATSLILLLLGFAAALAGAEGTGSIVGEGAGERGGDGDAEGGSEARDDFAQATRAATQERPAASDEDAAVAEALDRAMRDRRLYADSGLNLARIARRLGRPARAVSQAVNRVHAMSVSQYVNNFRIAEACRLLEESDLAVTQVVFEAGFMTKSNFNREFQRVTGTSPSAWRAKAVPGKVPNGIASRIA